MDEPQVALKKITGRFISNIQSVRVFNEQIGPVADEHDRSVLQQFVDDMNDLIPELEEAEGSIEISADADEKGDDGSSEPPSEGPEEMSLSVDAETFRSLVDTIDSTTKRSPGQGPLLRRGALTTLTSFFEVLLSELIQLFYSMNPRALPADTGKLSLAELRELGSIEDAEEYLVSREIDAILYEGVDEQLAYFNRRLNVDLNPLSVERPLLIEIFQRRNLLIHNNGVVNRQYLARVSPELIKEYEAEQGEPLFVTERYLTAAIDSIYVLGITLTQLCWRHWHKPSTEVADSVIIDRLYDSLVDGRFDLTAKLAQRCNGIRFATDDAARRAIINQAIALKQMGHSEEMEAILSSKDWSACGLGFKIALVALRDEDQVFYELLPKAVAAGELKDWYLREWPLFLSQRGTERFDQAVKEHFGNQTGSQSDEGHVE